MKYFLDTEFIEGSQKAWFGKTKPTIDLISIGIVCEDGREYCAISKDFNLKEAWNRYDVVSDFGTGTIGIQEKVYWIRDNVLLPIYKKYISGDMRNKYEFSYATMKWLIKNYGKSNKQISKEVRNFVYSEKLDSGGQLILGNFFPSDVPDVKFYGYYADYDWVVFCWLFGRMFDLPNGFPMYCIDIRQMIEEVDRFIHDTFRYKLSNDPVKVRMVEVIDGFKNTDRAFVTIKQNANFPTNKHSHDVLSDAKWHRDMYEYVMDVRNQLGIN